MPKLPTSYVVAATIVCAGILSNYRNSAERAAHKAAVEAKKKSDERLDSLARTTKFYAIAVERLEDLIGNHEDSVRIGDRYISKDDALLLKYEMQANALQSASTLLSVKPDEKEAIEGLAHEVPEQIRTQDQVARYSNPFRINRR